MELIPRSLGVGVDRWCLDIGPQPTWFNDEITFHWITLIAAAVFCLKQRLSPGLKKVNILNFGFAVLIQSLVIYPHLLTQYLLSILYLPYFFCK